MNDIIKKLYKSYVDSRVVTTDSRSVVPGSLFFAFKGDNFDGNEFVASALDRGAAICVTSDNRYASDPRCIVVGDVLNVLQSLARFRREHLTIPVIGITGTNGKTTTKELLTAVLRRRYRVHATEGNHNNHLGVPLTLLSIPDECDIAVVEMGANHPGEISALCDIAKPDYGLITSVGKAHLEGFGSFEGVVRTKTELYRFLDSRSGTIFVNAGNKVLIEESGKCKNASIVFFGDSNALPKSNVPSNNPIATCSLIGSDPYMSFYTEENDKVYRIQTNLFGAYNYENAMAALAVGKFFKVGLFDIKEAIEQYQPDNKRSQFKQGGRNKMFLDCYNANPTSMEAAIRSFAAIHAEHSVVMLGGMKELGHETAVEHRRIFELVQSCGFEKVVLIGDEFGFAKDLDGVTWFADSAAACVFFKANPISNTTILLKGSNGSKMWLLEDVL